MNAPQYFGTDGIRDVANTGRLTPELLIRIGRAIATYAEEGEGERKILIASDTRVSGQMISSLLGGALMSHGFDVHDTGVLPTPGAALLTRREGFRLGIVVSASHNPMPDNGIKLFGPDGRKLSAVDELRIDDMIVAAAIPESPPTGARVGRLVDFSEGENIYLDVMVNELFADLDLSDQRIIVDCANGAGSRVAPRLLSALGADVTAVHCTPDGLNINDGVGVFHVADLASAVAEQNANLALALDGDGDRVILLDETGEVRDGDYMLAILSRRLNGGHPQLVSTVMSNLGLRSLLRDAGVAFHQTAVGDRWVSECMEETGAPIGGEQSGHIVFHNEQGWFGDGIYTALEIMRVLLAENATLSSLASVMTKYPQVLENIAVSSKPPLDELDGIREALASHEATLGDEGRILLRYSGTEMLARVMVEGRDSEQIHEIAGDLASRIGSAIGK